MEVRERETVGIVGLGAMGRLIGQILPGHFVLGYDERPELGVEDIEQVPVLSELVERSDTIIIATPVPALSGLLRALKPELDRRKVKPLLVEVGSVKQYPEDVFSDQLPNYPEILLTHPLFGPQSTNNGTNFSDLPCFVTQQRGERANTFIDMWRNFGIIPFKVRAEEHDEMMLATQVVPFFLGRVLTQAGLIHKGGEKPAGLEYFSYLDANQTQELYKSVMGYNPHAQRTVEDLILRMKAFHGHLKVSENVADQPFWVATAFIAAVLRSMNFSAKNSFGAYTTSSRILQEILDEHTASTNESLDVEKIVVPIVEEAKTQLNLLKKVWESDHTAQQVA